MNNFIELLAAPFVQRALLAGLLVAILAGYYGVFVVQRRLSFLGDGLAHAAFGGVALGLLLGAEPLWIALPFTVAAAAGIVWTQQKTRIGGDTAIGIFFAASMALGVIFLSLRHTFSADAFSILFGDILYVTAADVWGAAAMLAAGAATLPMWGRWAYATFDRELAQSDRLDVPRDDYILAVSLAVVVVVSVKIVGIVLIAALLIVPAATARLGARSFRAMTLASIACAVAGVVIGMAISLAANLPTGPCIVLTHAAMFFAVALLNRRS